MTSASFLLMLLSVLFGGRGQQLGIQNKPERYMIMEIASAERGRAFEFTLIWLARSGKGCELKRLECKSPYKLSVSDEAYLILYGKSGEGKIATEYAMTEGSRRAYQHLEKGEAIVVEFLPKPVGGGYTKWWQQGSPSAPRMSMTIMSKDPTVY
ncbi:MAG TPA: hypothetical protein VMH23_20020 [Bacteroidota bacterium]|nr:hypothetical protein [Bacteroidota bacterium]